ncbi:hypothetical protein N7488_002322 [Penicillium malachiteum]|nr:hypothetical protein N7488_002322 [Penicillium malachiteum]
MSPPRNRKQRRAAAATESSPSESDIPLAHPPRNDAPATGKAPKTLVDIIAERQNELLQRQTGSPVPNPEMPPAMKSTGTRFVTVDASGDLVETDAAIDDEIAQSIGEQKEASKKEEDAESDVDRPLPPLLDTILLSLPLTTLHLTLAYLAAHQYAESTNVPRLVKDAVMGTFPLLTFLVHLFHGHLFSIRLPVRWSFLNPQPVSIIPFTRDKLSLSFLGRLIFPPTLRTIVYLPVAIMLGVHLITITNEDPYYAVMKKAPAYGTVWIWCILEMSFGAAVLGALGPLIWGVWWMGYGII